jgi:hypothetical protein
LLAEPINFGEISIYIYTPIIFFFASARKKTLCDHEVRKDLRVVYVKCTLCDSTERMKEIEKEIEDGERDSETVRE